MLHPITQAKLLLQIKQAEREQEKKKPKTKTKKPYLIGIVRW
jgi:hypothetical protein